MPADNNPADGIVTLQELYRYVYDYVIEYENAQHVQVYPENSSYQMFTR